MGEKPSISTSRRTFRRQASPNATCDVGVEHAARRGSRRRFRGRATRPRVAKGFRAPDEKRESGPGVATATPTPGVVVAALATRRRTRLVERYAVAIFDSRPDEGITGFLAKNRRFGRSDARFDAGRRQIFAEKGVLELGRSGATCRARFSKNGPDPSHRTGVVKTDAGRRFGRTCDTSSDASGRELRG